MITDCSQFVVEARSPRDSFRGAKVSSVLCRLVVNVCLG